MRALSKRGKYWAQIVAAQASSGEGIRAFCRQRGVTEAGFYAWRRELRWRGLLPRQGASRPASPPPAGFVAVVPAPTPGAVRSGVVLQVAGRLQIVLEPGFDRGTLAAALAVVSEASGCWH